MKKSGLILLLLTYYINSLGQNSYNKLTGQYVSNFAISGYGQYQIKLNSDFTFNFEFTACLLDFNSTGRYSIADNIINLQYDPFIPDTITYLTQPEDTLLRPSKLLFKNDKLFIYESDGSFKDKEIEKYTKQFLFFGQRKPRTKKFYLKKQDPI